MDIYTRVRVTARTPSPEDQMKLDSVAEQINKALKGQDEKVTDQDPFSD